MRLQDLLHLLSVHTLSFGGAPGPLRTPGAMHALLIICDRVRLQDVLHLLPVHALSFSGASSVLRAPGSLQRPRHAVCQ